jgi:NitT/TauT family transport system permease protein
MRRNWWQRVLLSAWMRPILLIVILLVLWDLAIRVFRIPPYLIPAPEAVVKQLYLEWPKLWREALVTTYATLGGFALSIAFGIPMALLIAYSRTIESFVYPLLVFSQSVPKIAIAPLILVWVGAGIGSKILVVTSIAFFPIVINTMAGFKEVDRGLADVFRSVDANERQMFFRLRLPYAMPYIFAGLRIATTLAVLGAIVAEWLAASNGLGYLVLSGSFNFNTARSFAAIIALAVIGTAFFAFMSWVERMISWKREGSDSTTTV